MAVKELYKKITKEMIKGDPAKVHEATILWGALTRSSTILEQDEIESVVSMFFEGLNNDGA